ncbi:unnamed protein product [Arctogadus glacialis]
MNMETITALVTCFLTERLIAADHRAAISVDVCGRRHTHAGRRSIVDVLVIHRFNRITVNESKPESKSRERGAELSAPPPGALPAPVPPSLGPEPAYRCRPGARAGSLLPQLIPVLFTRGLGTPIDRAICDRSLVGGHRHRRRCLACG